MNDNENKSNDSRDSAFWDDKSLMELFNRTVALMTRYLHLKLHNHDRQGDPHRGQGRVLSILKIKPDISQKDLGYLLDMRSQSLGELIMKLERAGYITRTPSEEDKRVVNIHLTELGQAAADRTEKRQADSGRFFDCLSAEEQANLSDYLKRLIIQTEGELNAAYGSCGDRRGDGRDDGRDDSRDNSPWQDLYQSKENLRRHSREMRDQIREHSRALRHELREHGCRLRDEIRRDPRLCGFYWGSRDNWGEGGPFQYHDDPRGERFQDDDDWTDRGNGPRPADPQPE